jgi:hypothetical protein
LFGLTSPTGFVDINENPIGLNDARYVVDRNIRTGIAGRNSLRGPRRVGLDLSLQRAFNVPFTRLEGSRFEIRADFFNVLNNNQCQYFGPNDANVLNPFFNQPTRNECGETTQYNRTGRIELRFVF